MFSLSLKQVLQKMGGKDKVDTTIVKRNPPAKIVMNKAVIVQKFQELLLTIVLLCTG